MAKLLKLRRGTTSQHGNFTGAEGECTVDMDKDVLVVHDGQTQGGHPVAAEDMANVSSTSIVSRIDNSALAGVKVQPNFGSQNVETTGTLASGNHTVTGNISVSGTVDGRDLATDGSKLDNIQAGATDDQTASEILTAIKTVDGANSGLDADVLDGQHGSYYQNASNLNAGTISDARLPNTISSDITGTAAYAQSVTVTGTNSNTTYYPLFTSGTGNQTVFNDGGGGLSFNASSNILSAGTFSGSGASLTSLNGSNISSGTIAAARVATLNQDTTGKAGSLYYNSNSQRISTLSNGLGFHNLANNTGNGHTLFYNSSTGLVGYATSITNNNQLTNGAGYTTYTSNQATDTTSNVNFASVTASGNVTAFSDATLKTDIHTINDALGIVGKLRGVTYKWLNNGEADIGVIAQEVQEVVPEVVKETLDGLKTVDYGRLVSVLINAVNELNEKLDKHIEGGK